MTVKAKKVGMFLLMVPAFLFSGGRELFGLAARAEEAGRTFSLEATPPVEMESSSQFNPEALEQAASEATQKLRLSESERPIFIIENGRLKIFGKQLKDPGDIQAPPSSQ